MNFPVAFKFVKGNAMAHSIPSHRAVSRRSTASVALLIARVADAFAVWRQRRTLGDLPEHLRHDVGLSEAEILRESRRPIWDVPQYWRF